MSQTRRGTCENVLKLVGALAALPLLMPSVADATEGALGRPISGSSVSPNIGIIPVEPAWIFNFNQIHFEGSLTGNRPVPIAGQISAGIDADLDFSMLTVMKVWALKTEQWSFASSFTLPYLSADAQSRFSLDRPTGTRKENQSGWFDLYFSPLIAGYHFSATEHMALSLNIWAPTGDYDPDRLANVGLNNWTFVPQLAYTHIFPESKLQVDAVTAVQFYTRNDDTDYQNAPLFTLDIMGRKLWGNGIGAGVVIGTVQQLGDDDGPIADRLDGFRGRDWAAGPIVTYDAKVGTSSLSLGLRWIPTLSNTRRLESNDTVMGTATLMF